MLDGIRKYSGVDFNEPYIGRSKRHKGKYVEFEERHKKAIS